MQSITGINGYGDRNEVFIVVDDPEMYVAKRNWCMPLLLNIRFIIAKAVPPIPTFHTPKTTAKEPYVIDVTVL